MGSDEKIRQRTGPFARPLQELPERLAGEKGRLIGQLQPQEMAWRQPAIQICRLFKGDCQFRVDHRVDRELVAQRQFGGLARACSLALVLTSWWRSGPRGFPSPVLPPAFPPVHGAGRCGRSGGAMPACRADPPANLPAALKLSSMGVARLSGRPQVTAQRAGLRTAAARQLVSAGESTGAPAFVQGAANGQ